MLSFILLCWEKWLDAPNLVEIQLNDEMFPKTNVFIRKQSLPPSATSLCSPMWEKSTSVHYRRWVNLSCWCLYWLSPNTFPEVAQQMDHKLSFPFRKKVFTGEELGWMDCGAFGGWPFVMLTGWGNEPVVSSETLWIMKMSPIGVNWSFFLMCWCKVLHVAHGLVTVEEGSAFGPDEFVVSWQVDFCLERHLVLVTHGNGHGNLGIRNWRVRRWPVFVLSFILYPP